ncbi:hypothetical protein NDU88_004268 [Pleurodeles waltl]|uniref:Uncharacterized protein n=1 Tax=Pleurodeles waltl TaxID=8319 RepID=A0AAV7VID4_PLEWA|nr:hypothetical protein NDU88_004268 [Pleurodeles waltl]
MDVPRCEESCRSVFLQKDRKQALLAAKLAVGVFGCCCGPGGTRMSPIALGDRGGAQQDKEPSQKQAAPADVPEQALRSVVKRCSPEVAQESPTPPEDNSGGRAMQVRVPWTQAWLCTKEIFLECTGAGVAAKHAVPSNAVWRGEARTYLHQTWTVGVTWTELLSSRDLARRAERRPRGPVMQFFGACGCRGKIPSTHGRFLQSF